MVLRSSISLLAAVVMPSCAIAQAVPAPQAVLPPAVTTVLPANTPGLVLIDATPAAWQAVDRFNPLPASLKMPLKLPFLPHAIDFAQDIQPWLGDRIAIALVPTAGSIAGSVFQTLDASAVLLAPVRDHDRFNTFLAKLKATRGQPAIEREYKGVTLLQWSAPAASPDITPEEEPPEKEPGSTTQRIPSSSGSLRAYSQPWIRTSQFSQTKAIQPTPLPEPLPTPSEPSALPAVPDPSTLLKPKGLAIALLPGSIAVATQAHTLEDLIDARSETVPLSQNPLFQRTLQHPQTGRSLLVSYGDVAAIAKFFVTIAKALPESPFPFPFLLPSLNDSQLTAMTKLYSTADSHVWLQPEGIHSQVNFYYTTPQAARATQTVPTANQLLTRLPAATYLSANSRNFKQQWQTMVAAPETNPTRQLLIAELGKAVRSATGLDPEKDVIPWMDGEYALFFFPTTEGFLNYLYPKLNLGVGLMLQTSDRAAAEAALKKLDQFVKKEARGELAIVPRRLKGQPIVSWEGKDNGKRVSVLSYAWLNENTIVMTTGAGAMAALNPKPYLPLHLNHTFQTATTSFPIPNEGYFYVNMGATLSFLYNLILPSVPQAYDPFIQEAQRIAGTVRSISTTNSATAEAQRVDSLWVMGPGANQPLKSDP